MSFRNGDKHSFSLKDRFQYWFDNRIAKGSLGLIHILFAASIVFTLLITGLIILFGFEEEGQIGETIWDGLANMINNEMPYSGDGGPGYLILMAVLALGGVLFTSVLIGFFSSAIEEKIINLKRGNSLVLEKDHIVVLGYYPGEYTLINQLILAASDHKACIVVGGDMERDEMEQDLKDNIDIPGNVRIVCRKVDITDPSSIEKCAVQTCRTIIISPTEDMTTVKAVLAVSALLQKLNVAGKQINAIVSRNENRFPLSLTEAHNICTLQTNDIIAKMVAHSCTQTGLSETFREVFNFEGNEFYLSEIEGAAGLSFEELMTRVNYAVPAGIYRDDKLIMNPGPDCMIRANDKVVVFSEDNDNARLQDANESSDKSAVPIGADYNEKQTSVMIFGYNENLPLILRELPEHVNKVSLVGQSLSGSILEKLKEIAAHRDFQLNIYPDEPETDEDLLGLVDFTEHVIILNRHDKEPDVADMEAIFLLLKLRDIKARYHKGFNITIEMQKEHNQKLVGEGDTTDFLVSSSMASLFLAQLAESPELISVFRELLSNKGNELYLKNVEDIHMVGTWSIRDLRRIVLRSGYIFLGYLDSDFVSHFNPDLDEQVKLESDYSIIVLGEQ